MNSSTVEEKKVVVGAKGNVAQLILESPLCPSSPQQKILGERIRKELNESRLEKVTSELTDTDLWQISERGYTLQRIIGRDEKTGEMHGKTRIAAQAEYKRGNVAKNAVIKVPLRVLDQNSPRSALNRAKGNRDFQEATVASKLNHSNVVNIYDSFQLEDGRTCNAEEFLEGQDLENLVRTAGKLSSNRVDDIFRGILAAINYAHSKGVLHRDLKPSNVMVGRGYGTKVVDWQNAGNTLHLGEEFCPTWGGAKYTSPRLLNAITKGEAVRSLGRDDLYSLGGILYFMTTGENPSELKLVESKNGTEIEVNGTTRRVALMDGEKNISEISLKENQKRVRKLTKKVPWKYRKFIRDLLNPEKDYTTSQAVEEFDKITRSWKSNALERAIRLGKITGITSTATLAAGLGAYLGIFVDGSSVSTVHEMTFGDMIRRQAQLNSHSQGDYYSASYYRDGAIPTPLERDLERAKKDLEDISKEYSHWFEEGKGGANGLDRLCEINGLDSRAISAMIKSMLTTKVGEKVQTGRVGLFMTPIEFYKANNLGKLDQDPHMQTVIAARHIQRCYSEGDSLVDMYLKAICDSDEIEKAKQEALIHRIYNKKIRGFGADLIPVQELMNPENIDPIDYFPREEPEKEGKFGKEIIPGFRDYLPPKKVQTIERALALYAISDERGNINWENYRKRPMRGLDAK